jgi:arginase family enzyme
MDHGVTVLDFDQTYHPQTFLHEPTNEWIDLSDIQGTNRYCELDSLSIIRQRIQKRHNRSITFIGSGNYHYVTYLLISEIQIPFTLLLFDNHTDMIESPCSTLISCGSWVLNAVEQLPMLKKVIIIGANRTYSKWLSQPRYRNISIYQNDTDAWNVTRTYSILSEIPTGSVYLSIDKDVLDRTEAITNWDQGNMKLRDLVQMVQTIGNIKRICGVDICGEYPLSPVELFYPERHDAIRKNEHANRILFNTILKLNIGKKWRLA